jgi:hypothetical protein
MGIGMQDSSAPTARDIEIARVLKPLGDGPLTRKQSAAASSLLKASG